MSPNPNEKRPTTQEIQNTPPTLSRIESVFGKILLATANTEETEKPHGENTTLPVREIDITNGAYSFRFQVNGRKPEKEILDAKEVYGDILIWNERILLMKIIFTKGGTMCIECNDKGEKMTLGDGFHNISFRPDELSKDSEPLKNLLEALSVLASSAQNGFHEYERTQREALERKLEMSRIELRTAIENLVKNVKSSS